MSKDKETFSSLAVVWDFWCCGVKHFGHFGQTFPSLENFEEEDESVADRAGLQDLIRPNYENPSPLNLSEMLKRMRNHLAEKDDGSLAAIFSCTFKRNRDWAGGFREALQYQEFFDYLMTVEGATTTDEYLNTNSGNMICMVCVPTLNFIEQTKGLK